MEFPLLLADQLGQHLKSLRKLRGWSQADLGQRIGVGQARVAAIEANPGSISVDQLLRIFQVLEVDLVARVRARPEISANLSANQVSDDSPVDAVHPVVQPAASKDSPCVWPAGTDLARWLKANQGQW